VLLRPEPVVVVSAGVVTPVGTDLDAFWSGLVTGSDGISVIERFPVGDLRVIRGGEIKKLPLPAGGEGGCRASRLLEAAEADITFVDGKFGVVGTDRVVVLKDVARAAFQPNQLPPGVEPGLYETGTFSPKQATWPNGCHVCEVEIDPDTGAVEIVSYVIVDDVGTVINPVTLKGQIHGGVAQGVGQALMEQVVYDRESGQLLTASFMDYAMPRGDTLPDMHIESNPVPTKLNPMGAKGAGEAGTVGALPVVMNAVIDALAPVGVRQLDMPATADRVWRAIQDAKTN